MVNILFTMLKEIFLSLVAKVAFKTVLERFSTRLVIYGLEKLKGYSTNEVVDETVQDVINQLKGKGLKVVDELGD
jgi:ribonuclease HII